MGQYMYFYVEVDKKLYFIDEVKDNGLHGFTQEFNVPFGNGRKLESSEIEYEIEDYKKAIETARDDINRNKELARLALSADAPLSERMELIEKYKLDNIEWKEYIQEKEEDIKYLERYVFLNKIFGDGAVWVGIETGRNFDPENPPAEKWKKREEEN